MYSPARYKSKQIPKVTTMFFLHILTAVSAAVIQRRAASSTGSLVAPSLDDWYTAPAGYEKALPGAILRVRTAPGNVAKAYNASAAYNILYRTTDSRYNATFAVTTLMVPPSGNGTKFLSYQIPYDTADLDASPSYVISEGSTYPDMAQALKMGWYVATPDYEGPLASFTAGVMSGHATLDGVRAVLAAGFGLSNNASYALWGYSGGALASEWAAELQVQYAPEMNFAGAALGGLTPNVTSVLESVNGGVEAGLIPAGILGLASQYPEYQQTLLSNLKTSGAMNATGFLDARNQSLGASIGAFINQNIGDYFTGGIAEITTSPESQYIINRDGIMGFHGIPQMPIFAYKAIQDEVSVVADTDKLVTRYCEVGANILLQRNTVGSHTTESTNGEARAMYFLNRVLSGQWTHTGCTNQTVTVSNNNVTVLPF